MWDQQKPDRTGTRRAFRLAAVLAMLAGAILAVASPAHAGVGAGAFCVTLPVDGPAHVRVVCVPQTEAFPQPACLGDCPYPYIDFLTTIVLPADDTAAISTGVVGGLNRLGEAALEPDPRLRAKLRSAALAAFSTAAKALGGAQLVVAEVAKQDGSAVSEPTLSLVLAFGKDLGAGLGLLATDPKSAGASLDRAFDELGQALAGGGQ